MAYVKILYQDSPSTATPLNAQNLNHMDDGIAENDRRLNELATAGVVNTFNGRTGAVTPESGDYTADMIPYDEENSVGDILGNATSEIDGITVANASGESFALVPTSEGNALATHIYGMSMQDGTPTPSSPVDIVSSKADFVCKNKNFIKFPYSHMSTTVRGINWSMGDDGAVIGNGTWNGTADSAQPYCETNGLSDNDGYSILLPNTWYTIESIRNSQYAIGTNVYFLDLTTKAQKSIQYVYSRNGGAETSTTSNNIYQSAYQAGGITTYTVAFKVSEKVYAQVQVRYMSKTQAGGVYTVTNDKQYPILMVGKYSSLDEMLPYVKGASTDITTDLTLRAIEVSSTDPYNLEKDGHYYIADTVDWSEDGGYVLTRRIKHLELTSDMQWTKAHTINAYFVTCSDHDKTLRKVASNRFVGTIWSSGAFPSGDVVCFHNSSNYLYFRKDDTTSTADWETWLDSNNLYADYILATPITETLTSEQAQSLLSLKTYDVSTSINAQTSPEPTVELEYAKTQTTALALSGHNEALIAQELEGLYGAKNLIPYPYADGASKSQNGITFTANSDGSVTVSGTASANTYFYICSATYDRALDLDTNNYKLSGCPFGGSWTSFALVITQNINGTRSTLGFDSGDGFDFTHIDDGTVRYDLEIKIGNGTAISTPITFYPMLRLATNTSNTYQPYAMTNYELTQKIRELETAIIELGGN